MSAHEIFGVYSDSEVATWNILQSNPALTVTEDLGDFLSHQYQTSIAIFHVAFPPDSNWLNRLAQVRPHVNKIIVLCSELHDATYVQLKSLDQFDVCIFVNGIINEPFQYASVCPWWDWFDTSTEFYRSRPDFLSSRISHSPKPIAFDILLGNARPHRDHVWNFIQQNNLSAQVLMTYTRYPGQNLLNSSEFILESDGVEYLSHVDYTHTVNWVKYYGHNMRMSQVVPCSIYNQTAYSLVTETNASNHYNFYTEKIVKPMLARRLFIAIAGQYYLRNLRALGFQTFSSIIDESYDTISDPIARWDAALGQLVKLTQQPQFDVILRIHQITEHNYNLITDKKWCNDFVKHLSLEVQSV